MTVQSRVTSVTEPNSARRAFEAALLSDLFCGQPRASAAIEPDRLLAEFADDLWDLRDTKLVIDRDLLKPLAAPDRDPTAFFRQRETAADFEEALADAQSLWERDDLEQLSVTSLQDICRKKVQAVVVGLASYVFRQFDALVASGQIGRFQSATANVARCTYFAMAAVDDGTASGSSVGANGRTTPTPEKPNSLPVRTVQFLVRQSYLASQAWILPRGISRAHPLLQSPPAELKPFLHVQSGPLLSSSDRQTPRSFRCVTLFHRYVVAESNSPVSPTPTEQFRRRRRRISPRQLGLEPATSSKRLSAGRLAGIVLCGLAIYFGRDLFTGPARQVGSRAWEPDRRSKPSTASHQKERRIARVGDVSRSSFPAGSTADVDELQRFRERHGLSPASDCLGACVRFALQNGRRLPPLLAQEFQGVSSSGRASELPSVDEVERRVAALTATTGVSHDELLHQVVAELKHAE